jgi:DNA-binding NarL/FixJ family response regulator
MEVLELLAAGLRNRQIAQKLFLSEKTVRNHISAILGKLHANDRTEAALIAARHGLGPADAGPGTSTGGP